MRLSPSAPSGGLGVSSCVGAPRRLVFSSARRGEAELTDFAVVCFGCRFRRGEAGESLGMAGAAAAFIFGSHAGRGSSV